MAAATKPTPAGKHVIHISAGEYEESESCVLPPDVSLVGAGIGKTVFRWNAVRSLDKNPMKFDFSGFMIQMENSSGATISGLTIIGSLPNDKRAHGGIFAHEERNVSIHDCEVKGLEFTGENPPGLDLFRDFHEQLRAGVGVHIDEQQPVSASHSRAGIAARAI